MNKMKTMWEPEWHKILIENLNHALKQCREAGIKVLDANDFDFELTEINYSPAMDNVQFRCKGVDLHVK